MSPPAALARLGGTAVLILWAAGAQAQSPSRIVGRAVDGSTQGPLPGAEVIAGDLRTTSGADGGFVLANVAPGRVAVEIRQIGYLPWAAELEIAPGLDHTVVATLEPAVIRLDSITVRAQPAGITIAGDELVRRGRDLGTALDGWQGVVVRRAGSAGPAAPQLRGGAPDEVLVLVDGFALNDPLSGRADLSRVASRDVARVTLFPGAQTVRGGGRALSGVIAVETRHVRHPEATSWAASDGARGIRLGASAGLLDLSVGGERYASGFGYTIPEVRGGGEAERLNAGGSLVTAAARLQGPVELTFRGSRSSRGLPGTTTNPTPFAHAEDATALVGFRREGSLRAQGSLQWIEARAADPAPVAGLPYDSYTRGVGGSAAVGLARHLRAARWRGEAGAAVEVRQDRFAGDGVRPQASFSQAAIRADATLRRGTANVVTLAPALRLDLWTGRSHPVLSARLDGSWQRGRTGFTAGLGSAVSPPVLADLLFRDGVGVRVNPDLRPERVRWELEAGIRRELGAGTARGSLAVRGFYGRVDDMVIWAPDFRFIWSPRNFDVRRHGGELVAELSPLRWVRADGSLSLASVTYDIPDGPQVQYRPRLNGSAGVTARGGPWSADVRGRYVGARYPNSAGTNALPAIVLLDAGVERRLGVWLTARAQVHDLTDTRAEFIAGYPTPGRSLSITLNAQVP